MNPSSTCPWAGLQPANLTFCEEDRCAWITQPANTWSNVGFLIVGVIILRLARGQRLRGAWFFGPIAVLTAFASSALHGTGTFMGQAADQIGMFLESALFVTLNLARWRRWPRPRLTAFYVILVAVSSALLLRYETLGIALFVAHIVTFAGIEVRLLLRHRTITDYRPLQSVVGLFALSYGLWWLDKLRIVCDPKNHVFTLHAAWHLLGATSFYFWFRFYEQFDQKQVATAPS